MTIARVQSHAFSGIDAVPVEVQVQISSGLPTFLMVGLPDKAVGEARERVRAALTAMGLALPPKRAERSTPHLPGHTSIAGLTQTRCLLTTSAP